MLANARDGAHQVGTIRMGRGAGAGRWSTAAAGSSAPPGLYVVSTAVLPTSGQANPTLTAVQLGLRLADDLRRRAAGEQSIGKEEDRPCDG